MDLGISEALAMQHLNGTEGFTSSGLGARPSLSSGAVTALVDRLQARGNVERRPHPTDRRSTVLVLTPAVLQEAGRHIGPLIRHVTLLADDLS